MKGATVNLWFDRSGVPKGCGDEDFEHYFEYYCNADYEDDED